jgi:hypothetical protein
MSPGRSIQRGVALRGRRSALSLLEVMLAMSLLVMLSSMTYWFYASVLETRTEGTKGAHRLRLIRVVMDRMATEIRQASMITADNRVGIRGEAEAIWLSTGRVPSRELSEERSVYEPPLPGEYDLTKVEYSIARHPDILHEEENWELPLGLARLEIKVPRPDRAQTGEGINEDEFIVGGEEGDAQFEAQLEAQEFEALEGELNAVDEGPDIQWEELYAPEIRYLRFCYYDGHSWWDKWDVVGDNPLPQLVMVTVGLKGCRALEEGESGRDEYNEEFCTCLNEEPPDCEPLRPDQHSMVVRVTQADPLFRSRITRETQAVMESLKDGVGDEDSEEGEAP